jgi:hypothetical protein
MRALLTTVVVALMFLAAPNDASAQVDRQKMDEISRMMFVDGDSHFLLVELMKDGFLKPKTSYYVSYGVNGVSVDGVKVAEPFSSRYLKMMLKFNETDSFTGDGSMRGDGIRFEDLFQQPSFTQHRMVNIPETYQHLINMLADDGLVGSAGNVAIMIDKDGVSVNGHLLTTPLEKIYERHILELSGFKPGKSNETFSILLKRGAH